METPTEPPIETPGAGPVVGADGIARCPWGAGDPVNLAYHDTEWGLRVGGEAAHLERLTLEAFQSGLSWRTILDKRESFRAAFAGFDADAVAAFDDGDVERLMGDAGIVRNRRKVDAAITNARATVALREQGGLEAFIWSFRPEPGPAPRTTADVPTTSAESIALSKALKKAGFAFVGPTTMHALMEAIGLVDDHLEGCHRRGCAG
jgi:DNA-3-methyladenine glycosylase I